MYPWISKIDGDDERVMCDLCGKPVKFSSRGEKAIKDHAEGDKHKEKAEKAKLARSFQNYFTRMYLIFLNTFCSFDGKNSSFLIILFAHLKMVFIF